MVEIVRTGGQRRIAFPRLVHFLQVAQIEIKHRLLVLLIRVTARSLALILRKLKIEVIERNFRCCARRHLRLGHFLPPQLKKL